MKASTSLPPSYFGHFTSTLGDWVPDEELWTSAFTNCSMDCTIQPISRVSAEVVVAFDVDSWIVGGLVTSTEVESS